MSSGGSGRTLLACDLGGTHVRTALVSADGAIEGLEVGDTPRETPEAFASVLRGRIEGSGSSPELAIVGVPGPTDYENGRVFDLPNLPGWVPFIDASRLAAEIGIPVLIAHDADLAVLGVHRFGAGRGVDDLLYVTLGTGIGAGVVLGGRLLHGRRSLAEGGHMIVDRESLQTVEALASGGAIARRTGAPAEELAARANAGDPAAFALMEEIAGTIGVAVLNLVMCFMPQRVVLGGGLLHLGAPFLEAVRGTLALAAEKHGLQADDVVAAEHEHDVGLLGASALWRDLEDSAWRGPSLRPFAPTSAAR